MGKIRRGPVVQAEAKLRFVDLPTRRFVTLDVDLIQEDPGTAIAFVSTEDYRGAVVKPRIRYRSGDEAALGSVLSAIDKELGGRAAHVMRPELVAVREAGNVEDPTMATLSPSSAAAEFMRRRPPRKVSLKRIRARLKELFAAVEHEPPRRPSAFRVARLWSKDWEPFPGEQEVRLGRGVYAVDGRFSGESGSSNRAGKTSVMSLVVAALFGKHRRVSDEGRLAHKDAGTTTVGVELKMLGGGSVEVERAFGKKPGLRVGSVTGKRDGQEEVESLIGVTRDDFLYSAYCGQNDLHGLIAEGSSRLTDELARWYGLDVWDDVNAVARKALKECADALQAAGQEVNRTRAALKSREWPSKVEVDSARKRYEKAVEANERSKQAPDDVKQLESLLEVVIEANRSRKMAKELPALKRRNADLEADEAKHAKAFDVARVEQGRLEDEIERLGTIRDRGFDGTCPLDGGACTRRSAVNENLGRVDAARKVLMEKKRVAKSRAIEARNSLEAARKARTKLAKKFGAAEAAAEAAARSDGLPKASELREQITKARKAAKVVPVDVAPLAAEYDLLSADRRHRSVLIKERDAAKAEVTRLEPEHRELRYLEMLTSRSGARSIQLKSAVVDLETATNSMLAELRADFRTEIEFERETKSLVDVCPHCGLLYGRPEKGKRRQTKCPDCGEARPKATKYEPTFAIKDASGSHGFEQDSGGGQSLLSIALRVALSRMLGFRVLFLDEVCGKLDQRNLQSFVGIVTRLPDIGFEQVLVVSHRPEVAEAVQNRLVVERDAAAGESRYFVE